MDIFFNKKKLVPQTGQLNNLCVSLLLIGQFESQDTVCVSRKRGFNVEQKEEAGGAEDNRLLWLISLRGLEKRETLQMMENVSAVTVFTLSGFDFKLEYRVVLFMVTLLWYLMIVSGNVSLIVIILMDKKLREPMYIFLCNLCINALYGSLGFYPKFLMDLLSLPVISYTGCLLQGYIIHSSNCGDLSILALMAYDRYVAICCPLMYHSVMTKQRISLFVFLSWFIPLNCMFLNTASLLGLKLCSSRINKIYCVNWMITAIACSPPKFNTIIGYINIFFYFSHFLFIIWSYIYMIKSCLSSKDDQQKFMQTCLPHLISLFIFVSTVLLDLMYMRFGEASISQHLRNFFAIEFLLVPPLVNPLIYGFKLTLVRERIMSIMHVKRKEAMGQALGLQGKSEHVHAHVRK